MPFDVLLSSKGAALQESSDGADKSSSGLGSANMTPFIGLAKVAGTLRGAGWTLRAAPPKVWTLPPPVG